MADNVYNLKFTLSNGDVIDAGQITAPQGPKGDKGDSADIPYSSSTPFMDGVGSVGSANTVARGDHRHPSDTSRQEKLVSGTNIKTINGQSVLGSGDISISGGGTIDADTLNGLLSGSNGIKVAKNSTGDKMQVALDLPNIDVTAATGIMTLTADASYTASSPVIKVVLKNNTASYTTIGSGRVSVHESGYGSHVDISGVGISVYDGDFDTTYYFLNSGNTKKIHGNSIYGYGNIDLYKHNVIISQGSTESDRMCVYCQILSSNNLNISSLADFQTIVKENEFIPATGKLKLYQGDTGSVIGGVCKSGAIEYNMRGKYTNNIDFSSGWGTINAVVSGGLTFYDTVTTV